MLQKIQKQQKMPVISTLPWNRKCKGLQLLFAPDVFASTVKSPYSLSSYSHYFFIVTSFP